MTKTKYAFYDLLIYVFISSLCLAYIIYFGVWHSTNTVTLKYMAKNIYLLVILGACFAIPIIGSFYLRFYYVENNDCVYFRYIFFFHELNKGLYNIDFKWNSDVFISEVESARLVKLSKEERKKKVFFKHLTNKYLEVKIKNGGCKYIYIGNYNYAQIVKIIDLLTSKL